MSIEDDIIDLINYDELPESLQEVHQTCGIEVVKILLKNMRGEIINVPSSLKYFKIAIRKYMEGKSTKDRKKLARAIGCSNTFLKTLK